MRKNSIDSSSPWTIDFILMCMAIFLLYTSLFMHFSSLHFLGEIAGLEVVKANFRFIPAFVLGMWLIGMLHAYLGDAYKRKHILTYSTFLLALSMLLPLASLADESPLWHLVAGIQGILFGLATTAGITVTIDITASPLRTRTNRLYALFARLGMFIGVLLGVSGWADRQFFSRGEDELYITAGMALLSMLLVLPVVVPFRSPIGISKFNIDRFFLPKAWLPAVSVFLLAFSAGYCPLLLPLLLFAASPLTTLFVRLSHHCQRSTANTTLQLAMDSGVLLGLCALVTDAFGVMDNLDALAGNYFYMAAGLTAVSLLFFLFVTLPYYRRHRVR
jgi:MFS family permease